jgi:anti-sigma regulatory factor (Ser/Thr protein kinase)
MCSRLSMEVPAAPAAVTRVRGAVTHFCEHLGLSGELADRIRLATTEACTNCVLHAYEDDDSHSTFALDARIEGGTLLLVVRDHGQGIAGSHGNRPDTLQLGMGLIEQLADSSCVSSRPGRGTRVAMRFAIPSGV